MTGIHGGALRQGVDQKGITRTKGRGTEKLETRVRFGGSAEFSTPPPPSQDVCEGGQGAGPHLAHGPHREASTHNGLRGEETEFTHMALSKQSHVASV